MRGPDGTLPLSEVFGPTLQGEGPHAGRPVWFVRLGLCNLSCEWCDTPYTWDDTRFDVAAECPDTPIDVILGRLTELGARPGSVVVLSGGEPLMHAARLPDLLVPEFEWHVETNGTIVPPDWWSERVTHASVSLKTITTSDVLRKRIKPTAIEAWTRLAQRGRAAFKFVVETADDVHAAIALTDGFDIDRQHVWFMPQGITVEDILHHQRQFADAAVEVGANVSTRLHTLLWGDERGR